MYVCVCLKSMYINELWLKITPLPWVCNAFHLKSRQTHLLYVCSGMLIRESHSYLSVTRMKKGVFVCVFMRYFMTSTVVSRLVLCETWLRTKSRLIKRVCVLELEADRGSGDRLVCVFAVRSENELNDPQPTQLLTSVCGGKPVSPARTPPHAVFLLHYCLRSFQNYMSSWDVSQSAHVPLLPLSIYSILPALSSISLPLPFPNFHSLCLFCLSLWLANPPHSSKCSHLHMI